MDRRKLKSSSSFHNHVLSASQTSLFPKNLSSTKSSKENIQRSISGNENLACKNSDKGREKLLHSHSPVQPAIVRKRKRNLIDDKDNENESHCDKNVKKKISLLNDSLFVQPKSNELSEKNNTEQQHCKGSYVMRILETLDKSPAKPSPSLNVPNKSKKIDLIVSKNNKTLSKIMSERIEKMDEYKNPEKLSVSTNKKKVNSNTTSELFSNISLDISSTSSDQLKNIDQDISLSESDIDDYMTSGSKKKKKKKFLGSPVISNVTKSHNKSSLFKSQVLESPELSPLKFQSPVKKNQCNRKMSNQNQDVNKFIDLLNKAGIRLAAGENLHSTNNNPREIIQKIKSLLKDYDIAEVLHYWNLYVDDEENLKKSLEEMTIETAEGVAISSKATSLSRILLQVPPLQTEIIDSLIKKLIDEVIATDSSGDSPWALQMLQQFRFLELIVAPNLLVSKLEELLSSSPEWFQRDIIVFIPDIVIDSQHRQTAEMLIKIMENNSDLTNIILECIYNLILRTDYKEELREKFINFLRIKQFEKKTVPAIAKFILSGCSTESIALKSFSVIRSVDMTPLPKEKPDECYTHQMFMINNIKMCIELCKEVNQAAISMIKNTDSEVLPLDFIILIILYDNMTLAKKKIIETTLYSHIKTGHYKVSILNTFYIGYKEVFRSLQSSSLSLAINLLKADSFIQVEFGIEWIRKIFVSQYDTPYNQREILERLINMMGNKNKTVKNALQVLEKMTNDEIECQYLQQHTCFLRIFLEKIDHLNFEEVASLYHILHGLCTQSDTVANILNDDLSIIIKKQLCSLKIISKCKGVLGAVMAIKHLAGSAETSHQALNQLKMTLEILKGCTRSQALFYDELTKVVLKTKNIDRIFLNEIAAYFEDLFISNCLVEKKFTGDLVPKFCLNDPSSTDSIGYIHFENEKVGAFISVLFKLLCTCYIRLSGSLESVDAVLGCAVLMPEDLNMPEPSTADYIIHCINWFRELISGFVVNKEDILREQLFKRLESLMKLQAEYVTMMSMIENRYQPPPCYFHLFPVPPFQRIEIKVGKKKKSQKRMKLNDEIQEKNKEDKEMTLNKSLISLSEWENWDFGSELTFKNPSYFRQMDIKIVHLLESNLNTATTHTAYKTITIPQVCFIVKELLFMIEHQASECLIRDLIQFLPKITNKLQQIITNLRNSENIHEKEAVRLFLCLLIKLFSWKEFKNAKYNTLLRDGLRTLAGMTSGTTSILLRSCKDLVSESYKLFESMDDIATQISLAVALVNICNCLMKHSKSFTDNSRERLATMAHGYLCLEWNNDKQDPLYKTAIKELLHIWIDNEPNPLKTVTSILEWLPEQVDLLETPNSRLNRLLSITKSNFYLLMKQLFDGIVKGIDVSLDFAGRDSERILVWKNVAFCLDKISSICKSNKNNNYLSLFLRYTSIIYQNFLTNGIKLLEANIKYETEEVISVIKSFQSSGRFLRDIFCTARKDKNVSLLKLIPIAKSRRERFIYRVKGMLTANNSIEAFWMGNLLNKDLDGEEIGSESSEDITADMDNVDCVSAGESDSEIFNSESEEDEDKNAD